MAGIPKGSLNVICSHWKFTSVRYGCTWKGCDEKADPRDGAWEKRGDTWIKSHFCGVHSPGHVIY